MSDLVFSPPGPGSWALDAAHCPRPRSRCANALVERHATEGFRAGFARYGVLLETLEVRAVGPFPYIAARPLGAPPGASGPPPRLVMKALLALHPALRRRTRQAAHVFRTAQWRDDLAEFWRELPGVESELAALATARLAEADDEGLAGHMDRLGTFIGRRLFDHFRRVPLCTLPVGDFLAFAEGAGIAPADAVGVLRGDSPASTAGGRAIERAAAAIAADGRARAILDAGDTPAETVARLRALEGAAGEATAQLLDRYGDTIVSGFDVTEHTLAELPAVLAAALRNGPPSPAPAEADRGAAGREDWIGAMRARVSAADHAEFDTRLAAARASYPVRDVQATLDLWALGVLRRALLTAGARLAARGALEQPDDVFDATCGEVAALCRGGQTPSARTIAAHARLRRGSRVSDAPLVLGPPPGSPPPADWLPPAAARVARAFGVYRSLMEDPEDATDRGTIRGVGASPGRAAGAARIVRGPEDFDRLRRGDILVAPTTSPSYNIVLPLLGGIVTDRGGVLSHAAIVSREYGIPGVVGARNATARIPDGAMVEVNGTTGEVSLLRV